MPSQHGVHCYLRGGGCQTGPDAYNTIEEFRSLPEILSEEGYVCGLTGKWHLGGNLEPQDGFTTWITKPHGHTSTFYDAEIIEDGRIRREPEYLTDFWTRHAVRFIRDNKDRRFFLLLAYNGPYGLGRSLERRAGNRHAPYYEKQELRSFPRESAHPWLLNNRNYIRNLQAIRRYASEVSGIDDGVGSVLEALEDHGLVDRTLVVFTADQGLCGGHHGMWGMGDHSRPLHTYDETIHIPLIFRQPGVIPAGTTSDLLVSNYDFYPSVLGYLGLEARIPSRPERPGRDYSPVLRGKSVPWENVVFYEFENSRMVRTGEWKYTLRFPEGPDELYDLERDPGETRNLADDPSHKAIRKGLGTRLEEFFDRFAAPRYDLRRGGGSKSWMLTAPEQEPLRPERRNPTRPPAPAKDTGLHGK
jgi:arylsulfatase A-like enzyme